MRLQVGNRENGQVHGVLSRGDAAIKCHPSGGYLGAIWTAPHRIRQLFQSLRSESLLGRGNWQAYVWDGCLFSWRFKHHFAKQFIDHRGNGADLLARLRIVVISAIAPPIPTPLGVLGNRERTLTPSRGLWIENDNTIRFRPIIVASVGEECVTDPLLKLLTAMEGDVKSA